MFTFAKLTKKVRKIHSIFVIRTKFGRYGRDDKNKSVYFNHDHDKMMKLDKKISSPYLRLIMQEKNKQILINLHDEMVVIILKRKFSDES